MKAKSFLIAVLLIAVSLPAIYQIITPGYFPIHDDTQIARVDQMYKALSDGQFPVRWIPDLGYGYGYPIFNFYNPLPYYFGASFMFFGADALLATKLMMAFGVILAGISMFVFTRAVFKGSNLSKRSDPSLWTALLATIFYIYAPYHAVQIYVRGAVAEYWAYAILPLVFYSIWKRKVVPAGLALAALITSHNLTAFMSIPFVALLTLVKFFEVKNKSLFTIHYSLFTALALGASAFFWIPAIAETAKTQVSQMVFENFDPPAKHLVTINQLWTSPWGYGGSSPGTDDGLSLQLGKVHLLGSIVTIVILLYCYIVKRKKNQLTIEQFNNLTIFSVVGLTFSLFMMLPISQLIWDSFPLLSYIQFPWRFLTFASLFSSILTAWAILKATEVCETFISHNKRQATSDKRQLIILVACCLLLVAYSTKFFQPQFKYPTSAAQLTSRERIFWEVSRRSDEYLPIGFIRPTTLEEALRIDSPTNQMLVDELKKPTPVRRLGNIISAITVIGMIGYYERLYRRQRR